LTLPLSCVQAIQGVCAEALDVAAVTTGLDGVPLTGVSNSCDYCTLILSTHEGRRRCGEAWLRALGGELHPCHAGLLCASAAIEIHASRVAIVSSCQFVAQPPTQPGQAWQTRVSTLAEELGLAEIELRATMDSVRGVTEVTLGRIPTLVQRMADTFSEIGEERLALLGRLQHISEMSRI
jgi:ligand-binding sensor protein